MRNELRAELERLMHLKDTTNGEILNLCRTIVPLLKDHGMPSLAEKLEGKLCEVDAINADLAKAVKGDLIAYLELIREARK